MSEGTWRILCVTTVGIDGVVYTRQDTFRAVTISPWRWSTYSFHGWEPSAELRVSRSRRFPFSLGCLFWIFFHGGFCLLGAKLFRVDVHTAAIASAANIGGAASAPIVAAHHKESLVPASILMALVGYAIGNYAGYLAAQLCWLVTLLPGG